MGSELSVYKQLTSDTSDCLSAIKREIGMKTTCTPFAVKLIGAMKKLYPKTDQQELDAANTLLAGLQTLMQGGILAEDYDKIDFVKRSNTIVVSARVEAFLRAAARKGYRITDTIVYVPKEDSDTTYFKENLMQNGDIVYTLEDRRINPDRAVTAQRLADRYFSKFLCRLDIRDARTNARILMTVCEMSAEEILAVSSVSEQGIYKSKWEEHKTKWGTKNEKVISDELNDDTFWVKWTSEMVNKTIIRRALKRVREVLPELTESIYAFEQDEYTEQPQEPPLVIDVPVQEVTEHIDIHNLTKEQTDECKELFELWRANPKLAEDKFNEIKAMISEGKTAQEIIDGEWAGICILQKSKTKWAEIGGYFSENGQG